MRIDEWEARYRAGERWEDRVIEPSPLVAGTAEKLAPGKALDIACGTGRNAIWLAERNWNVTAVDGSVTAIEQLIRRAQKLGVNVDARAADLESPHYTIEPGAYDLILKCYYLQRSLFPAVKAGVTHGGIVIVMVHTANADEEATYKHAAPGELRSFFADWEILHYFEGPPGDASHKRDAAEIVARKPIFPR